MDPFLWLHILLKSLVWVWAWVWVCVYFPKAKGKGTFLSLVKLTEELFLEAGNGGGSSWPDCKNVKRKSRRAVTAGTPHPIGSCYWFLKSFSLFDVTSFPRSPHSPR